MRHWRSLLALLAATLVVLLVAYTAIYFIFLYLFVDLWWFRSLEYEGYFWLRLLYRFFISGGITLIFFLIFFLNFWVASRYLGFNIPPQYLARPQDRQRIMRLFDMFVSGSMRLYTPLSLILAIIIAIPFYQQWESALLFIYGPSAGIVEPVYDNDVGFYMFRYPIFMLIQQELLITSTILFLGVGFLYWLEHSLLAKEGREYPLGAKIHLTSLVVFTFVIVAWGFMLDRFSLLYTDVHEPIYFGPGLVELRYHLPLIWTAMLSFLLGALALIVLIHSHGRRGAKPLLFFGVIFLSAWGLRHVVFIPDLINKYLVQPNPVKMERFFMENNIKATLDAYDLHKVQVKDYVAILDPRKDIAEWTAKRSLENIPLWDREMLYDVYKQLQGLRPYYTFPHVDEDRYFLKGHLQQVNLSAREMNIDLLPQEAHTWENTHLRYIQGYGAVITPTSQKAGEPIEWFLRDLNLHSDIGFDIEKSDIFYGLENYKYAIVPNKLTVPGISATDPQFIGEYTGKGGIPIPSLFRKLLFAFFYRNERIFFSLNITDESKLLMRRNIVERISTLAPYLALDGDPYLVAGKDNFYWIQDAYTISNWYPVSKTSRGEFNIGGGKNNREFNYIRNSVKVIVNAYDGSTHFYVTDPKDPIIRAYRRAYPGVFKSMARIPEELKSHLRYPRDLFFHQMSIYSKYHQTQPELFYQQAETWQYSTVQQKILKPYYLTTEFPGCPDLERFVLVVPMTPVGRHNLSAIAVASLQDLESCNDDGYALGISAFKFRKDVQVNGPAQVSALIDQDPEISERFTLWNQHGSRVSQGRMVVLPMGDSVVYVQPIYLISTQTRIPQMVRVIVSVGNRVVMEKSLEEAFARLRNIFIEEETLQLLPPAPVIDLPPPPPPSESAPVEQPAAAGEMPSD